MSDFKIIPSSIKYPSAPNNDQSLDLSFVSTINDINDYDRNLSINLQDVYNKERQGCTNYRPTFKLNLVYDNAYYGSTNYKSLNDSLYYVNPEYSLDSGVWYGYPQYYEFDFYRPETYEHIVYKPKSGFTYNWNYYLTYPFENDYNKRLMYYDGFSSVEWVASDGIPFKLVNSRGNGVNLLSFICVCPHNLTVGQYVEFPFYYEKANRFEVFSLGNGTDESENYIFNIVNVGYTGNTFNEGKISTFKRIINPNNLETKSKYYIRRNKVILDYNDIDVTKAGFELLPFNEEKKIEYSVLTPNNKQRVSQKSSNNTFNFTTKKSISVKGLLDNQNRVLSEIYLSVMHCGYYGLFNKPFGGVGLKQGWGFNITPENNSWWLSSFSNSSIKTSSYVVSGKEFYYNRPLSVGDTIDGDFCEWNDYEQNEYVLSEYIQKIIYNEDVFNINSENGFYYAPHNKMVLRVFSDYIETSETNSFDSSVNWAFYSNSDNEFRWRDLYDIGFIDNIGNGVDYPYLNNSHYPFNISVFRVFPEGNYSNFKINTNFSGDASNNKLITDDCE